MDNNLIWFFGGFLEAGQGLEHSHNQPGLRISS